MKGTKKEGDETVVSYDTRMKGTVEGKGQLPYHTPNY
jgi:hypothetical protein